MLIDNRKSREAAIEFMDYLALKGLMARPTAHARKAALGAVLGILDKEEASDVTTINFGEVMSRFSNLHSKKYTPASLRTYGQRAKAALDDFANYVQNPLAFKTGVQTRERKQDSVKPATAVSRNAPDAGSPDVVRPHSSAPSGPMANSILPIPIRAELTVYIQGLPFDLTGAEAKKIAGVVQAMAVSA